MTGEDGDTRAGKVPHRAQQRVHSGQCRERKFRVEGAHVGERFEKVVVALVPGLGRKGARRLFEEGKNSRHGRVPTRAIWRVRATKSPIGIADTLVPRPPARRTARRSRRESAPGRGPEASPPTYGADSPWRNGALASVLVAHYPEMARHRSLCA